MLCAIWCHFYDLETVNSTYKGVLVIVKNNTPPWVFFTFFKLCKWDQIAQGDTFGKNIIYCYEMNFYHVIKFPVNHGT